MSNSVTGVKANPSKQIPFERCTCMLDIKAGTLVTDDLIIYVFQPPSRPYSDQLIGLVPHTQPSPPIPMGLNIAIDIHTAQISPDLIVNAIESENSCKFNSSTVVPWHTWRRLDVLHLAWSAYVISI